MLKIYNSKTKQKQIFKPIKKDIVSVYVCGITVYDRCHIGHARAFVIFDMVVRYLKSINYSVNYIRNITDIDDKIIKKAVKENTTIDVITQRYIQHMHDDIAKLKLLKPTKEPRATETIAQMLKLIQILIDKGHAYVGKSENVYYKVESFANYGELAHKDLEALRVGIRIQVAQDKDNPLDFVLWKKAKPGEPSWDSPWGKGRPGWHIECSAMSMHYLGDTIDIHGGGADLKFPHHENERAQSEAATGKTFVNTWMHAGFVNINDEKMSKSLGNFFTIEEVLAKYHPEVIRYFMIASHYRSPINYSIENLESAKKALSRMYLCLDSINIKNPSIDFNNINLSKNSEQFHAAMQDDFNTPKALAVLFDSINEINSLKVAGKVEEARILAAELISYANILGLLNDTPQSFLKFIPEENQTDSVSAADIDAMLAKREQARTNKDWATADEIRDSLANSGIVIEDKAGKTTWRRV